MTRHGRLAFFGAVISAWALGLGLAHTPARAIGPNLLGAGMLPVGTYPLQVLPLAASSASGSSGYQQTTDPDPSVIVTANGTGQTQDFKLSPGEIVRKLVGSLQSPSPLVTYLSELQIQGIFFPADPPVPYRTTNAAGLVMPNQPWSWTLHSSNGGVTLSQTSVAQLPSTEMVRGLPVLVQRIDTTLTFSDNGSGTLNLTHWEAVGDPTKAREHYQGSVTFLGSTSDIDTTLVLGGLGGLSTDFPYDGGVNAGADSRVVDIASRPDGSGYWKLYADGTVVPGGKAPYYGSATQYLACQCFVAIASTSTGNGYWLLTNQGAPYTFGDAPYLGGANQPPYPSNFVDIEATGSGMGYWILSNQGAPYTFGNAKYHGGANAPPYPSNFVRMAAAPPTMVAGVVTDPAPGYWILSDQGAPYSFGSAPYLGGTNQPPYPSKFVDIAATRDGNGYWILDNQGAPYTFGNAAYKGGANYPPYPSNFVALAVTGPASVGPVDTGPAGGYWIVDDTGAESGYGNAY